MSREALQTTSIIGALLLWCVYAFAQSQQVEFQDLPKEVRDYAVQVRSACKEVDENLALDEMQGISIVDLAVKGPRAIIVDNEGLCSNWIKGANLFGSGL
jgi:hypothetical protein